MSKYTSGYDIERDLREILEGYSEEVTQAVGKAIREVANESVKKLKSSAPQRTGKYAAGWTKTIEADGLIVEATVHGGPHTYPLAHLLENGHAKRGGGRTAPIVHIKPVENWAAEEAQRKIKEKVESL